MASSIRLTRFRLIAAALVVLLIAGLGFLVSRLTILNEHSVRADIVSQLAAWTGGSVEISGPLRLESFPRLTLRAYTFELKSAPNIPHLNSISAREIRVELGLWSLLSREAKFKRVILIDPRIALNIEKPGTNDPVSLVDTAGNAPVSIIKIVNGEITASGPQTTEKFTGLNGIAFMTAPQGALDARGNLAWRGQKLNFTFNATPSATTDNGAKTQIALSVQSPLVSAEVEGEGTLDDILRVTGMLDLQVTNLRGFARWLGLLIPDGPGLGPFVASGGFQLQGSRIGFNEGTFALDGNRALGTLTVEFDEPRPKIAGTLAFSTIDVAKYWERKVPQPKASAKDGKTKRPQRVVVDFPLLHHLDFDLRLSTSEMTATPLTLGQVALSVAVNSGRLVADFAILDLCAGTGSGRLAFDAAVPESEIRLTGRVSDLEMQSCLKALGAEKIVTGGLDLSIDLTSRGRTGGEILHQLGGKVLVDAGPGEIGLNLGPITRNGSLPAKIAGWQPLRNGSTLFDKASAELIFRQGKIFTDSLKVISGETRYTGEGLVDMNAKSLDFNLEVGAMPQETAAAGQPPANAPVSSVSVTGPWSKPVFNVKKTMTELAPNPTGTVEARTQ